MVTLSAQEDAFGVGIGAAFGSMLVSPDDATTGPIAPGAGVVATSGVDSGSDAALTVGPPGAVLQTTPEELPTMPDVTVPVGLATDVDSGVCKTPVVEVPVPVAFDASGVTGVLKFATDDGGAQTTNVPGVLGFEASGTGANVVPGVPEMAAEENGPGLLSGDDTIAPGVVGRLMDVVPIVATCAWPSVQPASRATIAATAIRITRPLPHWVSAAAPRPCCRQPD
jgi:hypothetical protein